MSKPLDRIKAKVTRAKQHIQDFQLGLDAYYRSGPYAIGVKDKPESGQRVYYIAKVDCLPDSLTAIAADVIQNLRSPLDHIAYQLVLDARSGTEPDWTVYYPISGSAAHYPATRGGKIKGVRQEVVDAIDATEPYKGGKGHALWQLNELNKPDKHELLIGAGSVHTGVDIAPDMRQALAEAMGAHPSMAAALTDTLQQIRPLILRPADPLLPLKVGDELYAEPIDKKVAQNRHFTFDVAFNAPGVIGPESALKTLQDMANLVDNIVTTLGRFLP